MRPLFSLYLFCNPAATQMQEELAAFYAVTLRSPAQPVYQLHPGMSNELSVLV